MQIYDDDDDVEVAFPFGIHGSLPHVEVAYSFSMDGPLPYVEVVYSFEGIGRYLMMR